MAITDRGSGAKSPSSQGGGMGTRGYTSSRPPANTDAKEPPPTAENAEEEEASQAPPKSKLPSITLILLLLLFVGSMLYMLYAHNKDTITKVISSLMEMVGISKRAAPQEPADSQSLGETLHQPIVQALALSSQLTARACMATNMTESSNGDEKGEVQPVDEPKQTTTATNKPQKSVVSLGATLKKQLTGEARSSASANSGTAVWPEIRLTAVIGSSSKGVAHVNGEFISTGDKNRQGLLLKRIEGQGAYFELEGEERYIAINCEPKSPPKK